MFSERFLKMIEKYEHRNHYMRIAAATQLLIMRNEKFGDGKGIGYENEDELIDLIYNFILQTRDDISRNIIKEYIELAMNEGLIITIEEDSEGD